MRSIDLSKIDDQIKKLEELRRFMADPTTAPILEQLISESNLPDEMVLKTTPLPKGTLRGDLAREVKAICHAYGGNEFTAKDVIQQLERRRFIFKAHDKLIAVNGTLRRLVKNHVIKVVMVGSGKRPSTYKIPERFPRLEKEGTEAA